MDTEQTQNDLSTQLAASVNSSVNDNLKELRKVSREMYEKSLMALVGMAVLIFAMDLSGKATNKIPVIGTVITIAKVPIKTVAVLCMPIILIAVLIFYTLSRLKF